MKIDHEIVLNGDSAIVEITGPIKSSTAPVFEEYINNLIQDRINNIIIDGKDIDYISSEGIGLLILLNKKIMLQQGGLVLCALDSEVRSLFSLLGFDRLFVMVDEREEAFLALRDRENYFDDKNELLAEYADNNKYSPGAGNESHTDRADAGPEEESLEEKTRNDIPVASENNPYEELTVFDPFVIECVVCKSLVRVKHSGRHFCPKCNREFNILNDQSVVF